MSNPTEQRSKYEEPWASKDFDQKADLRVLETVIGQHATIQHIEHRNVALERLARTREIASQQGAMIVEAHPVVRSDAEFAKRMGDGRVIHIVVNGKDLQVVAFEARVSFWGKQPMLAEDAIALQPMLDALPAGEVWMHSLSG